MKQDEMYSKWNRSKESLAAQFSKGKSPLWLSDSRQSSRPEQKTIKTFSETKDYQDQGTYNVI